MSQLNPGEIQQCLQLVQVNLKEMYEKTIGWDQQAKLNELSLPQMRFFLVKNESAQIIAFTSFTEEFGTEVEEEWIIYCYELQVKREFQANGLGRNLMDKLEERGREIKAVKILLTCFCCNQQAMRFYQLRGYQEDESSPQGKIPYRILSLEL